MEVKMLGDCSDSLYQVHKKIEAMTKGMLSEKETTILRAAAHSLREAHCMIVGVKWMLEQ